MCMIFFGLTNYRSFIPPSPNDTAEFFKRVEESRQVPGTSLFTICHYHFHLFLKEEVLQIFNL